MKRYIVFLAVTMFLSAGFANAATNVSSMNIVGNMIFQLPPTGQYLQVGIQFDAFDATLVGVLGTNQLRSGNLPAQADKVYIWDTAGTPGYKTYALKTSTKQYHYTTNWSGPPVNPPLVVGQAIWLQSALTSAMPAEITVLGEVVAAATQAVTIVTGFQMIAYPFSCDVNLQDMGFSYDGAQAGLLPGNADQIYAWQKNAYQGYGLKSSDHLWHHLTNWSGAAADVNMILGQGFWYLSRKTGQWTWHPTNSFWGVIFPIFPFGG